VIRGTEAADVIVGTDGADLIDGGGAPERGGERICAGAGNDRITAVGSFGLFAFESNQIDAGEGNDWIDAQGHVWHLLGGPGDDVLRANTHFGPFDGGDGNDTLVITAGFAMSISTDIIVDAPDVHGGPGNDRIEGHGLLTVFGDAGDDHITTDGGGFETPRAGATFVALGGPGNDVIEHRSGSFVMLGGGDGNDMIRAPDSSEMEVTGCGGQDVISAGTFVPAEPFNFYRVSGGAERDVCRAGQGVAVTECEITTGTL